MRSREHTLLYHSTICAIAVLIVSCATSNVDDDEPITTLEDLQDFEYIYVLGPHDIPDGQDGDGVQDRPRIRIWNRDGKVALQGMELKYYGDAQTQVMAMLGSGFKTVDQDSWKSNYHHIAEKQEGGIVFADGTIVGWLCKPGGLGYFDFDYDPIVEKIAWFTPKLNTDEPTPPIGRIYRARDRN